MKHIKHGLITAMMLLCCLTASAHDFEVDGIYYKITSSSNFTVAVTCKGDNWQNYSEEDKYIDNISIPQHVTYNDVTYQVTSVDDYAFYYCTELAHVILPEGITDIGYMAYYRCDNLTSIIVPEGVRNIENFAFGDCANLKYVILPSSLLETGFFVFQSCVNLTYIVCNAEVPPTLGSEPFYNVDSSIPVYVPASSVTAYQSVGEWNKFTDIQPIVTASGTCGDNLTWNYANYGILTIDGAGTMNDYSSGEENKVPWYEYREFINEIIINEGVTSIGNYAFEECSKLYSVNLPKSLTTIGEFAFRNTHSLRCLSIPEGVTELKNCAFQSSNLESIYIPKAVSAIGDGILSGCNNLMSIEVDQDNDVYDSRESCNAIIETNSNHLIAGCYFTFIPSTVTAIWTGAFLNIKNITSIDIPNSVTYIGMCAFTGCSNLTSIVIPQNVSYIGVMALQDCNLSAITCYAETPPTLESSAFVNVNKSIPVYVPKSSVATYQSAKGWSEFTNIQPLIPVVIASGSCGENLTWTLNNEGVLDIKGSGEMANYDWSINAPWFDFAHKIKTVSMDSAITSIGDFAFSYCTEFVSINIPENVTSIGCNAFQYCENLCDILIPEGVVSIGEEAFISCRNLKNIVIPKGLTKIANFTFSESGLETIIIPKEVAFLDYGAFFNCRYLKSITCKALVPPIGNNNSKIFYNVDKTIPVYVPAGSIDAYESAECWSEFSNIIGIREILTSGICGHNLTWTLYSDGELVIEGVGEMCNTTPWAEYKENITSVTIKDGVTTIGDYAFYGCSSLTAITLPKDMTSIGTDAFYGCSSLTAIILPKGITSIENRTFSQCSSLTFIEIPEGVTEIKFDAFLNCCKLAAIVLPKSLKKIYFTAFGTCRELTNVYCKAESVPNADDSAFYGALNQNSTLHVPGSALESYRTTSPWCTFSKFETLETTVVVEGITLSQSSATLTEGESLPLTATVTPDNATDQSITWSSSNTAVATIDTNGKVTAVKPGTTTITALANDGSGVSASCRVTVVAASYTITYYVDGEEYHQEILTCGSTIVPINEPTKDGYTFSGWSEIPETMPANDITISGNFTINKYLVTFIIGDEVIASDSLEYGATIIAPKAPEKEGHTFNSWGEVAETVPASELTYEGTYSVNLYLLTYVIDSETIQVDSVTYGTEIIVIDEPTKEGYTFSGWSETPETMPANDVVITGTFTINQYTVTYVIDGEVFATDTITYGESITLPDVPIREGYDFTWTEEIPKAMPAENIVINGSYNTSTDIVNIGHNEEILYIYTINGKCVSKLHQGLSIVQMKDGTIRKVFVRQK